MREAARDVAKKNSEAARGAASDKTPAADEIVDGNMNEDGEEELPSEVDKPVDAEDIS